MTADLLNRAAEKLGHPMQRVTDPFLAHAALALPTPTFQAQDRTNGMGRIPSLVPPGRSLTTGLSPQGPSGPMARFRRATQALRRFLGTAEPAPEEMDAKTWRLNRQFQLNQGQTPQCVAYTKTHWHLTVPTYTRLREAMSPEEFYVRCKQYDGYPNVDGTTAQAALQVATEEGVVESSWWWTGPQDNDAARTWVQTKGAMWYGVFLPESFFRTSREVEGLCVIDGPLLYGHEMEVIGWTRSWKGQGPCFQLLNSWGDVWGVRGRGWVKESDFYRMLEEGGDLVGVVERKAA